MVTGQLYDDLGVLQACRAYEAAAGSAWPSPQLSSCLERIARPADATVLAKRWTGGGCSPNTETIKREDLMANKEQKRSNREAKKRKQKKKGADKRATGKGLTAKA